MKKQGGRGGIGTLEASCGEWTKTKRFRVFFGHFSPHCPGLLVLFFGKPIQSACSCYCAGSNSLNKLFLTVVAPHGYRSSTLVQGPQYGALRVALNTRAKRLNIFGEGFFLITVLGKCGLRIWQNNSNECKRSENQTGFCSFTCFFFFFSKLHIYQCGFTESKLHAVGDCGPQEAMLFCSDGERLSLTFLSPWWKVCAFSAWYVWASHAGRGWCRCSWACLRVKGRWCLHAALAMVRFVISDML